MSKKILLEKRTDKVALLTLDNPPLNVITLEMTARLTQIVEHLEKDDNVRAVVITGKGERAFCAGADIREFNSVRDDVVNKKLKRENELFQKIEDLSIPVIAAMAATTLGGGSELVLACDLRIMANEAKIGFPEIKLGVFPGSGGIYRLPRIVGQQYALELMFTGDLIDAKEAFRIGLVNRLVPRENVLNFSLELASRIAKGPKLGLNSIKKGVRKSFELDREQMLQLNLQLSDEVFKSDDCDEGAKAFFEKRTPKFK